MANNKLNYQQNLYIGIACICYAFAYTVENDVALLSLTDLPARL